MTFKTTGTVYNKLYCFLKFKLLLTRERFAYKFDSLANVSNNNRLTRTSHCHYQPPFHLWGFHLDNFFLNSSLYRFRKIARSDFQVALCPSFQISSAIYEESSSSTDVRHFDLYSLQVILRLAYYEHD